MHAPIFIATRGSALALAQANMILAQCGASFPQFDFRLKIIKTTGDKLQAASLADANPEAPRGLFTKELEVALLRGEADLAVHSLKDLPTDLPAGLKLAAVGQRADVRDVLIYRDADCALRTPDPSRTLRGLKPGAGLRDFPAGATIATGSTRRQAQLLAARPDLKLAPIRGNVGTRLKKLAEKPALDGLVLAAAGLARLQFDILPGGQLHGGGVPQGLLATFLSTDEMLPCVGQAAIGIETRINDGRTDAICERLNDDQTFQCVTAERAFLRAMGGGCLSPVAAYAERVGDHIRLRAVSFRSQTARRGEAQRGILEAAALGEQLAAELR